MYASQRHARCDAQAHSQWRGIDNAPWLIGTACPGAYYEALAAQRGVKHLLQCAVEVTDAHMHNALAHAGPFCRACRFLQAGSYDLLCLFVQLSIVLGRL